MSAVIGALRVNLGLDSAQFQRGLSRASDGLERMQMHLGRLAAATGGILSAGAALRMADQWATLRNSLLASGASTEQASQALENIAGIAQRTRAPLEATAQLYQRISVAAADLGASQADTLRFTENVGLALGAVGAGGASAEGALLQLAQAMGGTNVQAEEFNSLMDGAYPVVLAAARGIDEAGGSVGRLRALVVDGKVSSQEFFAAILSQTDELEAAFARTSPTIAGALNVMNGALTKFVGGMDQGTGVRGCVGSQLGAMRFSMRAQAAMVMSCSEVWTRNS